EVLVFAFEVEGAALEVLFEVAALLFLEDDGLLLEILARALEIVLLTLEGVLGLLELRLHLILVLLSGIALVDRPLHVDHGHPQLAARAARPASQRGSDRDRQ